MLSYLIRRSRGLLAWAILASVVKGVCSVLLVAQISAALTAADADGRAEAVWRFAAVAVVAMLSHMASSVLFERLSHRSHAVLRRYIAQRVLAADFRRLEAVGGPTVNSALAEHSARVAEFFVGLPAILVNSIIVTGCLVYMAWLSWSVFAVAVCVIALGSFGYHLAHLRAIRHLDVASGEQDRLFGHFRSLVEGAKELRLHAAKRARFDGDVLGRTIETVRHRRTVGMSIFVISSAWGNFLIYAFIGLVLFVLVGDVPDRARVMTGFALVFVYMVAPLENLLLVLPRANLAKVSGARIDEITGQLSHTEGQAGGWPARPGRIGLEGVTHRYYHEGADGVFSIGPADLTFVPGELTYLVGGNGSGKTTLAKVLVGLYAPDEGRVTVDGRVVDDTTRDAYRQLFSAIFSDFHLFDDLLDSGAPDLDARGNALLEKLNLHHKVQVRDGAFTSRALSQGQRKRLALVVAYLEDRPFLVFDEWAADQDPAFKDVFYRELLPELKARGKMVLVISHDDRYFHLADRIVRMENGQVVSVEGPHGQAANAEAVSSAGAVHPAASGRA